MSEPMSKFCLNQFDRRYSVAWSRYYRSSCALELPGYNVRTYYGSNNTYVKSRYLINAYVGKHDIMQEILYKTPNSKHQDDFIPISPVAFRNLLPGLKMFQLNEPWSCVSSDWWQYMEIVEMEGRILFKFNIVDWRRFVWGVTLDTIDRTFAGLLIGKFCPILSVASKYESTIKDIEGAAEVLDAIKGLALTKLKRNGYFETEISSLRSNIEDLTKRMEGYDQQLEETCNASASALNTLDEKFGIVVSI